MILKPRQVFLIIMVTMISSISLADQAEGQRLWNTVTNERSCTTCHGDHPAQTGKHVKTGKVIKPMAASVSSDRYQDSKKVEKWFLRNCKWTFGRQCSDQEKADILSWLSAQ
ncbi:MAG: DUF1924 domain-containing protein [Gammaproteobacteria bacterium]|nr:DUF1924 domain-containing protein [Gammaproteobacteria bacterium]